MPVRADMVQDALPHVAQTFIEGGSITAVWGILSMKVIMADNSNHTTVHREVWYNTQVTNRVRIENR
jgi:hypothetical protein